MRRGNPALGQETGEHARGEQDTPLGQERAQFVQPTAYALLGGVLAHAQRGAKRPQVAAFVEAQHDGVAVFGREFVNGFVELFLLRH